MHEGDLDQNKSSIFWQFACVGGCVQSLMLAQKFRIGMSEFWPILTFLLEQQTKFVLISLTLILSIRKE